MRSNLNIFQPITKFIIINPIMELLSITYTLPDYIKIHSINPKKKHHLPDPLVFVGGLANLTTPNTLTVVLACNSLSFRYLYSVVFVFFSVWHCFFYHQRWRQNLFLFVYRSRVVFWCFFLMWYVEISFMLFDKRNNWFNNYCFLC